MSQVQGETASFSSGIRTGTAPQGQPRAKQIWVTLLPGPRENSGQGAALLCALPTRGGTKWGRQLQTEKGRGPTTETKSRRGLEARSGALARGDAQTQQPGRIPTRPLPTDPESFHLGESGLESQAPLAGWLPLRGWRRRGKRGSILRNASWLWEQGTPRSPQLARRPHSASRAGGPGGWGQLGPHRHPIQGPAHTDLGFGAES